MTPERWKRVEELYHAAQVHAPGERAAFLDGACADDRGLRRKSRRSWTSGYPMTGFSPGPLRR